MVFINRMMTAIVKSKKKKILQKYVSGLKLKQKSFKSKKPNFAFFKLEKNKKHLLKRRSTRFRIKLNPFKSVLLSNYLIDVFKKQKEAKKFKCTIASRYYQYKRHWYFLNQGRPKYLVKLKRKNEYKRSLHPYCFFSKLFIWKNYIKYLYKRKKRSKVLFLYKRIGFRASYTFFFKQYRLLKYLFYNYFHKFSELNFKLIKKIYKAKLSITKFEKFLYYTESRVPTMLIRTKFARTHHQSFNFTLYGGVFVNNFKVLYYNYLIIIQDLIELAFRFFLYAFTKRYIRYFAFRPKMNKRSIIMRYYRVFKAGKRELFKSKQKMHTLKLFKNFFYKNMCLLAIIILEIPLKFEYRIFNKMFSFKTLMYLHVLN